MIIFEGPDGAGKTTLIKSFQELSGLPINPRAVAQDTTPLIDDMRRWVWDNVQQGFQEKIFDRHRLISEFIYGSVIRVEQQPGFTDPEWVLGMIGRFYTLDPIIIYCLPPLEAVRANVSADPDNVAVAEFIEPLYTAYLQKAMTDMHYRPTRTIIHDYTQAFEGETEGLILGLLADHRAGRKTNA